LQVIEGNGYLYNHLLMLPSRGSTNLLTLQLSAPLN
jgi:hypothetical protein